MLAWFLTLYIHTHKVNLITHWKRIFKWETNFGIGITIAIIAILGIFNLIPYFPHIVYGIVFCFLKYDLINKISIGFEKLENTGYEK